MISQCDNGPTAVAVAHSLSFLMPQPTHGAQVPGWRALRSAAGTISSSAQELFFNNLLCQGGCLATPLWQGGWRWVGSNIYSGNGDIRRRQRCGHSVLAAMPMYVGSYAATFCLWDQATSAQRRPLSSAAGSSVRAIGHCRGIAAVSVLPKGSRALGVSY